MMHVLLESAAPGPTRLGGWTGVSVAMHVGIVAAALWLTLAPPIEPLAANPVRPVVWVDVPAPPRLTPAALPHGQVPRLGPLTIPPVAVPTITFPDYLPTTHSSTAFPASRIFGDPRGTSPDPVPGAILEPDQVDQVVRPRAGNPTPAFPSQLRSAGAEGDVLVRFVVDTLGRVEPRSVEIREATHPLFGDAVRSWLQRTRYDPATVRGAPVRQLVEQRVGFSLRR